MYIDLAEKEILQKNIIHVFISIYSTLSVCNLLFSSAWINSNKGDRSLSAIHTRRDKERSQSWCVCVWRQSHRPWRKGRTHMHTYIWLVCLMIQTLMN